MSNIENRAKSGEHNEKNFEKFDMKNFCEQVAKAIGGEITPERVENVIKLSNEGKHIFHGIKREIYVPEVESEGVKPLAPEGKWASFWTSGTRLFGDLRRDGSLVSYDTTFFHYGHTETEDKGYIMMTIAMTNSDALNQISKIDIKDNDYLEIRFHVSRDKIFIIKIKMSRKLLEERTHREMGMAIEQKMFEEIEKALKEGYQLGGGVTIEI